MTVDGLEVEILPGRVAAVGQRLAAARRFLRDRDTPAGIRAEAFFANDGERLSGELRTLSRQIRDGDADGTGSRAWRTLRGLEREVEAFLGEAFALLAGARLVELEAGHGPEEAALHRGAEGLLHELGVDVGIPWDGLVVPALGWALSPRPGVIRLPFPMSGPWELPLAAHEFGHVVEERLVGPRGMPEVRNAVRAHANPAHLRELFADLYATWAVGPAYGFATVLLRLSPGDGGGPTHPADDLRADWILGALRRSGRRVKNAEWDAAVDRLEAARPVPSGADAWDDEGGREDAPAGPGEAELDGFIELLDQVPGIAYDGWHRTLNLRDAMDPARRGTPELPPGGTVRDVLNAAWMARLTWPEAEGAIRSEALRLLRDAAQPR